MTADHEWLAFNDNVWPAVRISGRTPRHPDDLPGALIDFHPTTAEGIRAKAAAILAMEDAGCYGGDLRDDSCALTSSVLVDMAGLPGCCSARTPSQLRRLPSSSEQPRHPRRAVSRHQADGLADVF